MHAGLTDPRDSPACERAAPDHVAGVRAAFVDHLTAGEVAQLGTLLAAVRDRRWARLA